MLTLLAFLFLVVGGGMLTIGIVGMKRYWFEEGGYIPLDIIGSMLLLAFLGCGIGSLSLLADIKTSYKYDDQIAIVEEVNEELEKQICSSVEIYLKHEENIYENLNIDTAIGLFSAYPNLKSNELVSSLISTYKENSNEIKKLKIKKTELARTKFLVYFG